MFVRSMQWRITSNVDTINETFKKNKHCNELIEYWPASAFWEDPPLTKDGSIIIFESLGRVDPSIIDKVGIDNLVQYHIWSMEQLEAKWFTIVEEKGYWPGFVMLEDLSGLGWHSLSQNVLSVCHEIVKINQNYYPDMLRKMWVLNVPSIFYMSWKVIQLWLEQRTLIKIELCSNGIEEVADRVYKVIVLENLPERLGGTYPRDIGLGGLVKAPSMELEKSVGWIDIHRSSHFDTHFDFVEGDIISWQFKTKYYDIGFSLHHNSKEIIPHARHDSDKRVIEGSYQILSSGSYTFKWDNSYSWTKGKELQYNIKQNNDFVYPS